MFDLKQIKEAHSKVKSGADFPGYVQDLINLGIIKYDTYVNDGHSVYYGKNGYQVQSDSKYQPLHVEATSGGEKFKRCLLIHQQGQTDYPTFCRQSAEAGIERWTVDMNAMSCTYYDKSNNEIFKEKIPGV